ncbi:RsmB/NOP family class I SAM-dependent RNA methyltransferase [Alterisphingorhabdus coralli]|uniref:RsmB/NOP family class I SAM-dependent RNA methyltransferase n=1 Tax=Alterisphingorhabdus coralli TaxID=3071408 RepID=A0AA97F8E0_9SPHN|nr:RsmB/NOP family class I SAM-dependent RNA methyltransferase [Parasphingorhabdus sp. SCSIO 66989]WOE75172.1 RsmB/NOP family class I SAM-dependent RNA methyltransferase [Parasphingorhabdus sp. SCSIO 66989]
MTDIAGLATRRAALTMLDAVLRRGDALDQVEARACRHLELPEDKAMARAIAAETLRHMVDLDALIDARTRQPLADDAKARTVLRMMLAQALVLKTPAHAVVATGLELLSGGPRRLAHGVFGALMRGDPALPEKPTLPETVAQRWRDHWGDAMVEAASIGLAKAPPIDITLRDPETAAHPGGTELIPGHIRLSESGPVPAMPGYAEGAWWVQNISAALPARLLGNGAGRSVYDLCAAPGGKTMQLAVKGWQVTALDLSEKRNRRLSENLERTGLAANIITMDALRWQPEAQADAVLLDAPCTATGIFRRHPDVLHRISERDIADRAQLQAKMLEQAAAWLKPGGHLLYAVCSLEPEEGEAQIGQFLDAHSDFLINAVTPDELPDGLSPTDEGYVRILPHHLAELGGMDGFFIARMQREN